MSVLSIKKRWEIIFLSKHRRGPKLSNAEIARELKVSPHVVSFWLERYLETKNVEEISKSGGPRKTCMEQDKVIISLAKRDREQSAKDIQKTLKKRKIDVSTRTISNRLKENGIEYRAPLLKPLLTNLHREKRLSWAQEYEFMDWNKVIFTDESSFVLYRHPKRVWRYKGERIVIQKSEVSKESSRLGLFFF